ncbi:MAG: signal peptide peptidase SppA [Spirochaetes bacterium]|nr:signal peptide peptidase SppA [Spirochaetota bacterium]
MLLQKELWYLVRNISKMTLLLLACILINTIVAGKAVANIKQQANDVLMPGATVSMPGIPSYSVINPVFADINEAFSLQYRYAHINKGDIGMHYAATTIFGFTCAYSTVEALFKDENVVKTEGHSWYFAKGIMLSDWLGVGVSYNRYTVESEPVKSWGYSLLLFPSRFLSFGMVVDHANEPSLNQTTVKQRQWYSIGIRPFGNVISLAWDIKRYRGEKWDDVLHMFTLSGIVWHDIMYSVQYDTDKNIFFAMAIPFDISTRTGGTSMYDFGYMNFDKQKATAYTFGITLTEERFRNAFSSKMRYLSIVLREEVKEIKEKGVFEPSRASFFDIVRSLREAMYDKSIAGIVIQIDAPALNFAQAQELREEIKRCKQKGKPVYCILASMGNLEYYIASSASTIFYVPNQPFAITGLKAEVYFFKGLLDKVGVKFEEVKKGQYKSFGESFTRQQMSDAARENIISLLKDLNLQFINDIAKDRNISVGEVEQCIAAGMLTPQQAKDKGFIDEIARPFDVMQRLGVERYGLSYLVTCENYIEEKMFVYEWGQKPRIAVIYVEGNIIRGQSREDGIFQPTMIGDVNYQKYLTKVFSDRDVKAVVIRINSGGGSAIASDLMWHSLMAMKKKYKKPVVISFGNIAASGGYYIACTNDTVFTSKATITGSIGVIFGKLNLEELYNKLGINKETIKMSEFADIFSESRPFTEKEKQLIQKSVDFTYNEFIKKVELGRNIPASTIPMVAEGKVFTGSQALQNGLADREGGLIAALSYAATLAGIKGEFQVEQLPQKDMDLRKILKGTSFQASLSGILQYVLNTVMFESLSNEEVLLLYPYDIVIQ